MTKRRTSVKKKAKELAQYLRGEQPNYAYLKSVFKHLRVELEVEVPKTPKKLPYVPTEDIIRRYYEVVCQSKKFQDMMIIKTLLYTGVRVSELVNIKLTDIDFQYCQIRITQGKGKKDRIVPFPETFKEMVVLHAENMRKKQAAHLFESSWNKKYTDRGIRKIMARYSEQAGLEQSISPHKLRHFLLTWLKKQGVDDALIQPYSGHESRQSLEIYSKLAITEAQKEYNDVIDRFPV